MTNFFLGSILLSYSSYTYNKTHPCGPRPVIINTNPGRSLYPKYIEVLRCSGGDQSHSSSYRYNELKNIFLKSKIILLQQRTEADVQ